MQKKVTVFIPRAPSPAMRDMVRSGMNPMTPRFSPKNALEAQPKQPAEQDKRIKKK